MWLSNFGIKIVCKTNVGVNYVACPSEQERSEFLVTKIQSGPKKCVHSLLINIFGINLNEISISGWEPAGADVLKCIHT